MQEQESDYIMWMKEYVSLRTGNKDSALPLMQLKEYYGSLSDNDKSKVNNQMIDIISDYVSNNQTEEAMVMIDLYDFLTVHNDVKLSDLYFIKGNIYADRLDSVMLKETIVQIEKIKGKQEYIEHLNDYLSQIRKLSSTNMGIGGYWVSDVLLTDVWGYGFDIPKYIMNVVNGNDVTEMIIDTKCPFITKECITTKGFMTIPLPQVSQCFFPISRDSVYVAWSSEKLKNYDADLVGLLRQTTGLTAATVSGVFAQRNKYSKSEAMLGSMTAGLVEIGLNSVFDALFTPSKKIYVLEGRLKRINDYILCGKLKYTQSKIKAGNEANARFETKVDDVSLLKWTPESGVVFMSWNCSPLTPYPISMVSVEKQKKMIEKQKRKMEKIKNKRGKVLKGASLGGLVGNNADFYNKNAVDETILPYWKDLMNDTSTDYGRACLDYKKSKSKKEFIKEWNRKQIEKLKEYNIMQCQ